MSDTIYQLIEKYSNVNLPIASGTEFEPIEIDFDKLEERCVYFQTPFINRMFGKDNPMYGNGKPLSEEHKEKLSKALIGQKYSKERCKNMSNARKGCKGNYTKSVKTPLGIFNTVHEAAEAHNMKSGNFIKLRLKHNKWPEYRYI